MNADLYESGWADRHGTAEPHLDRQLWRSSDDYRHGWQEADAVLRSGTVAPPA